MPDLPNILRRVDRVMAPDLWPSASSRTPSPPAPPPVRGRILTIVLAVAVAGAGIGVAIAALGTSSSNRTGPGTTTAPSGELSLAPTRTTGPTPTPSPSTKPVELHLPPRDGPNQVARIEDGRLLVQAPIGELEWELNPAGGCSLTVSRLGGTPLASFGGGCGGPVLGVGVSGTTWHGDLIRSIHGSVVPEPGWIVRITLDNGDTFDVTPLDGLWMAVVNGCRGTEQVVATRVAAIDPSGTERASQSFGPLPPPVDPCNRPTPSP